MKAYEKEVVRELAKKLNELSQLPIMEERRKLWYAHNDLKTDYPVVDCSPEGGWRETIRPDMLKCEDEEMRAIEWELRARIYRAEVINDDVPAERWWDCRKLISDTGWGIEGKSAEGVFANDYEMIPTICAVPFVWRHDFKFDEGAAEFDPLITEEDMEDPDLPERLVRPQIIYDEEGSKKRLELHQELLGDILDVHWSGQRWFPIWWTETLTRLRGYQDTLTDLYDYEDELHAFLKKMQQLYLEYYQELLDRGLMDLNQSCQYNGSGGFCYTNDLPELKPGEKLTFKHLWGFSESQEFNIVSPEMHRDFAINYERELLGEFGLSSYGCCDPLEHKLDDVFTIPNIRRISVSPWADVASMRDQIGMKAIFSCKPNPSYITNGWDADQQRTYITKLLEDGKGTPFEIILKDTHTLQNDPSRLRKWTDMCRECIAKVYG